jgi:hypothetical protein
MRTNGAGERSICGDELAPQPLGQRDVDGVIRREVRTQLEYPINEQKVSVSLERQVPVLIERFPRSLDAEQSLAQSPAEGGNNLDIGQGRNVSRILDGAELGLDAQPDICPEQVLDDGRRVEDDDTQDAFLSERSCRIRSAADDRMRTGVLRATRSKTSSRAGSATSRSRSSWM